MYTLTNISGVLILQQRLEISKGKGGALSQCDCAPPSPSARWPQCDCACTPAGEGAVLALDTATHALRRAEPVVTAGLPGGYTAFLSPYEPFGRVAVLDPRAVQVWHRLPQGTFRPQDLPAAHRDLLEPMRMAGLVVPAEARPAPLWQGPPPVRTYWVELTPACNLRCPYCYVDKQGPVLSVEVARAFLASVFQQARQEGGEVYLKFAGGEPTLVWERLVEIHRLAAALAREANVPYRPGLLTNATRLTPERLDWLAREGFSLMVSIDGVGAFHDHTRALPLQGRGTFEQVDAAIRQARARDLPLSLSHTVTRLNVAGLVDFVAYAVEVGAAFNLNFYRPPQWPHPLAPDLEELTEHLHRAMDWLEAHLPPYRIIDGLLDRARFDYPHQHACAAGHTYFALGARGQVASCPMLLGREGASVAAPRVEEKPDCASCPWRYWCGGGCPVLAQAAAGDIGAASPYCPVYRSLYPRLVRLEGLRVLQTVGAAVA